MILVFLSDRSSGFPCSSRSVVPWGGRDYGGGDLGIGYVSIAILVRPRSCLLPRLDKLDMLNRGQRKGIACHSLGCHHGVGQHVWLGLAAGFAVA